MKATLTPSFAIGRILNAANKSRGAQRLQKGVTMIELSVVLVVGALLAAAVFFGLQANQRRVEVSDNTTAVTEIISSIKKTFGRANQYGVMTTALAVQSRAIPDNLRLTAATAQNSYGGAIAIAPVVCVAANDCASIMWPSVPQSQCMDLVIGTQAGARLIQVAAVTVKPLDGALNVATLATQCELANTALIEWRVGR